MQKGVFDYINHLIIFLSDFAYCKHKTQWYSFSDSIITEVTESQILVNINN